MKPSSRHSIRDFVNGLDIGTRVVWIPNGVMGTIQPDHTILWDDGHHMTRNQMSDTHALLIHSEAERRQVTRALENRLKCLKKGCTLMQWDPADCKENTDQELCPLGLISETSDSEVHMEVFRRRRTIRSVKQHLYEPADRERKSA